jgi:V/A-type H+-transporting ATPase subunit K
MRKLITLSSTAIFATIVVVLLITLASSVSRVYGQEEQAAETHIAREYSEQGAKVVVWGFAAAAFSTAIGCIGAGVAVAYVGSAALGAVGEKPELAARALIYVGLAEGIAIYGLIISIMILTKI